MKTVKNFFGIGSSEGDAPAIPEHSQIQMRCLKIYLADYQSVFLDLSLSSEMEVGSVVTYISEVFRQLHSHEIVMTESSHTYLWRENELPEVRMQMINVHGLHACILSML